MFSFENSNKPSFFWFIFLLLTSLPRGWSGRNKKWKVGSSPQVGIAPPPVERPSGKRSDTETNKNRLVWQDCCFAMYLQPWMSLAGEQIAAEALTKSFDLSNFYQDAIEHGYPKVWVPFPHHSSSTCSCNHELSGSHFTRDNCLFLDRVLFYSPLRWHAKTNSYFISYMSSSISFLIAISSYLYS